MRTDVDVYARTQTYMHGRKRICMDANVYARTRTDIRTDAANALERDDTCTSNERVDCFLLITTVFYFLPILYASSTVNILAISPSQIMSFTINHDI